MSKKAMFETVKSRMHPDYVGKYGILICRAGATIIVDEDDITDAELEKLYRNKRCQN